jgi:hypothetical protein
MTRHSYERDVSSFHAAVVFGKEAFTTVTAKKHAAY